MTSRASPIDDLIDFTPALRAEAIEAIKNYKLGPIYTPGTLAVPNGTSGTIVVPGLGGGANWPGGAADPETGFVYVGSTTTPGVIGLMPNTDQKASGVDTDYTFGRTLPTIQGLRLMKPPYGRITAYNMNKGEIAWQIPNGDTPPAVKNNPALKGLTIPKTGSPSQAGIMVTKTLVFAGEGAGGLAVFHAYDKATGQEIWQTPLPGPQVSLPDDLHAQRPSVHRRRRARHRDVGRAAVAYAFPPPDTGRGGRGGRGAGRAAADAAERTRRTRRDVEAGLQTRLGTPMRRLYVFIIAIGAVVIAGSEDPALRTAVYAQHETASDIEDGGRVFRQSCANCHGPDGNEIPGVDLGRGQFKTAKTDDDLVAIIRKGVPGTPMPATNMSDEQAKRVVAYLRSLAATKTSGTATGDAARGKALFEGKGGCVSCHRVNGVGSRVGPDLTSRWTAAPIGRS